MRTIIRNRLRLKNWFGCCVVAILVCLSGCQDRTPAVSPPPTSETTGSTSAGNATPLEAASQPSAIFRFDDVTQLSAVSFEYRNGEEAGHFSILESLGGGATAIDYDLDGFDDLAFSGGGYFGPDNQILPKSSGLFRNRGNRKFTDVSLLTGITDNRFYSHGLARTDFDNDGFADFLVTGYGGVDLYHNLGDGTFERTAAAHTGLTDELWSSSAAWGDLNGDGHPDLYIAHYANWSFDNDPYCKAPPPADREICPPRSYDPLPDTLYLSNGDGSFRNATSESGIRTDGKGLGVIITDLDVDGDLDVYITNDTVPNALYRNDGHAQMEDVSLLSGTSLSDRGVPDGSMGVDVCDFNRDGLPELWVVNYERETSALYQNSGNMVFRHVSQRTGINAVGGLYVGWGTCCQDFDLDGDEDMFVSNGHVVRYPTNAPLRQLPLLFDNLAGQRFRNAAPSAGEYFTTAHMGRGAAATDLDNNGTVDLAISRTNEPVAILSNISPVAGWIQISLIGRTSAREPVGAVVTLKTADGPQTRIVRSGGSYASSSGERLFFGLGSAVQVAELKIQWPSGKSQTLANLASGRLLRIIEPAESETHVRQIPN